MDIEQSLDKSLNGTYTNMLRVVKNVTWRQRFTNEVFYAGLSRTSTTIRRLSFKVIVGGEKLKLLEISQNPKHAKGSLR